MANRTSILTSSTGRKMHSNSIRNFFQGVGSILDLFPSPNPKSINKKFCIEKKGDQWILKESDSPFLDDLIALGNDWFNVGASLRVAITEFTEEEMLEK